MGKSINSVNLLRGQEKSFLDKFIDWALTGGRAILIVTEIIALTAFLYRFSLDRELVDLHDKIKQQQSIVALLQPNEVKYRNLQQRLQLVHGVETRGEEQTKLTGDVIAIATGKILIKTFSYSDDSMRIEATTQTIQLLTKFIDDLKAYSSVDTVSLDRIENKTSDGTIAVGISIALKKAP